MNQRIKELALTCGGWNQVYGDQKFMIKETFNVEKFAELIIRECAKIADIADENKCEWIGGSVLTHFGLEQ